ncbi:MAG: asparagine synthase (glutamine-hydrolyzing) [Thermoanaerobaculia bacterium]
MCGIVGWVGGKEVDRKILSRMTRSLAHRGPDGEGISIFSGGRVGFGHRRLAILDLGSTGAQPVERDGHVLVQNGEIYNFRELRRADRNRSFEYRGVGDAETLLRELALRGGAALADLEGMFAFAYFDPRDRSLLLVRDRLGIKPLYYFEKGETFLFASEPRALLVHPEVSSEIDPAAFGDFLSYGYVPFDRCLFRGIRKLPPGHALIRKDGVSRVFPYWEPAPVAVTNEPVEQLQELLERAVRSHSVSDVPVGAFLSGGLDSSAVTALLRKGSDEEISTFTVAYLGGGLEDLTYSRKVSERFGTRHFAEELEMSNLSADLDRFASIFDEPVSDATSLAVDHLSRLARARVKVVLSGDGGDEVFGGYGWQESSLVYEARRKRVSVLLPLLSWLDSHVLSNLEGRAWASRLGGSRKFVSADPVARYFALRSFFSGEERRAIFAPAFRTEDPAWLFRRFYRSEKAPASRLCHLDLRTYLPDNILARVDRASMAHGLEVRVPLLDRALVEFAMSLPDDMLLRPGKTKILFRRAIESWLPREILDRPKYGFSPPFKQWVRSGGGEKALGQLRTGSLSQDGLLDVRALERRVAGGMPRRWNKVWLLLVLEHWYKTWIVDSRVRAESVPA